MKKAYLSFSIPILFLVFHSASCLAGQIIFHKPEFKGKVIGAETKTPIEGAVVVAFYYKQSIVDWGGPSNYLTHYKEVLTDKNGEFYFPAYTTIISPNAVEYPTEFIIYKPGYGNFPNNTMSPPTNIDRQTTENFFIVENFGKQLDVKVVDWTGGKWNYITQKVTFGLVELPLLNTYKDRLNAIPGNEPTGFGSKELPLLFKAINDERKAFGLKPVGRPF